MNWVTVDFYKLIQLLLPTFLRKQKQTVLLNIFIKPLDNLYKETLYKMQHNCTVMSLEKVLNEYFQTPGYEATNHELTKKVKIIDEKYEPDNYIYLEKEFRPSVDHDNADLWLDVDDIYLENEIEYFHFVVLIPSTYVFVTEKVRAIIDYYKLAGKKYRIELY